MCVLCAQMWPDEAREPYVVLIRHGIDPARVARPPENFQHVRARNALRVTRAEQDQGGRA